MNDLSLKFRPNIRNRDVTGMSRKNGTKEANMRPYGPDASVPMQFVSARQMEEKDLTSALAHDYANNWHIII